MKGEVGAAFPEKIDLVSTNDTEVALSIVQTDPITDDLLIKLQDKINNYAAFALDGQMLEMYPESKGKSIKIVVFLYEDCHPLTMEFLEKVKETLRPEGIVKYVY